MRVKLACAFLLTLVIGIGLFAVILSPENDTNDLVEQWPSFRGQNAWGISERSAPPMSWNIEDGTNIHWATPIPGLSHASPIVWSDCI